MLLATLTVLTLERSWGPVCRTGIQSTLKEGAVESDTGTDMRGTSVTARVAIPFSRWAVCCTAGAGMVC